MAARKNSWDRDRARIHALKTKAIANNPGFSDDNYRDMIADISQGKVESSKELKPAQRYELIRRLAELAGENPPRPPFGKGGSEAGGGVFSGRPNNMDRGGSRAEQLKKIEALLTIGKKPWGYADAIAKNVCKVDKVQWVETENLYRIISALTYQAKRQGWDLEVDNGHHRR